MQYNSLFAFFPSYNYFFHLNKKKTRYIDQYNILFCSLKKQLHDLKIFRNLAMFFNDEDTVLFHPSCLRSHSSHHRISS